MKKNLTLLIILLVAAYSGFAQDTLTGVVSRVAAPYFEQNVCDSRFAIMAEGETYYVMVDNYWPNPYLEELVIHYDTISVGNEIEVVGEIKEMEDGNGEYFQTIDISKNLNSNHQQILGFFYYNEVSYPGPDSISAASFVKYTGLDLYHIVINGELQTGIPFIINGRTLMEDKRYLFIGDNDVWTDYNGNSFNVFELVDALPYDVADLNIEGTLTTENDLCVLAPCGETRFLSLFDGNEYHYLTNKRKLKNNYFNDAIFMEGDYSGGTCFYIITPNGGFSDDDFLIVGNDTVLVTTQQMKASCTPSIFINNYLTPNYSVHIHQVELEEHEETLQCTLAVASNPFYWGNTLIVTTIDNDTCFLQPYLYTNTPPDHITIGDKTVCVGDSFTASGMVSYWYHNNEILEKVLENFFHCTNCTCKDQITLIERSL